LAEHGLLPEKMDGDDLQQHITKQFIPAGKSMNIRIIEADYGNTEHGQAIIDLVNAYSMDPMGRNRPLTEKERENLIPGLRKHPSYFTLLAYVDGRPLGIANCVLGFSTFWSAPLVNIHDIAVLSDVRGKGVGTRLLEAVDDKAREMDCCKVTMEVRTDNHAQRLYKKHGYGDDDPPMMFWHKKLQG
jgi:GNAT superfamily N-acetyltransferase